MKIRKENLIADNTGREQQEDYPLPISDHLLLHHESSVNNIKIKWKQDKQIPPVLLITGIEGVGKRAIAYHLAQWYMCYATNATPVLEQTNHKPCGTCKSCICALSGSWVNFTELLAEQGETLKIDRFRELKNEMIFGAYEDDYRFVLISNAERLTPSAANSILKLLEEPPAGWILLLTSSNSSLLLPTIVSRCQLLRLKPLPMDTLVKLIENTNSPQALSPEQIFMSARLACGSLKRALFYLHFEVLDLRRIFFDLLGGRNNGFTPLIELLSQDSNKLNVFLNLYEFILHELILSNQQLQTSDKQNFESFRESFHQCFHQCFQWMSGDEKTAFNQYLNSLAIKLRTSTKMRDYWLERCEQIAECRNKVLLQVNKKLLIQELIMTI